MANGIIPQSHFDYLAEQRTTQRQNQLLNQQQINNIITAQEVNKAFNTYTQDKNSDRFVQRMRTLGHMFGNEKLQQFELPAYANLQPVYGIDESGKTTPFGMVPKGAKVIKTPSSVDTGDLSSQQQLQARSLARKIYGVRGAERGVPVIYDEMRQGKTIDQIEDELRYAGQSPEFTGATRDAAQSILIDTSDNMAQSAMDRIDDLVSKGDTEGVKSQLKQLARKRAGVEDAKLLIGKERTIKLLDEIQSDLNRLEQMGINTNIFTGTAEQIASKVGTVKNAEARKVATKIATAIQSYRRSMTGVAFTPAEAREYYIMFPGIGRTANFNTANINALKEVFQGDLDNFYSLAMGPDAYSRLFSAQSSEEQTPQASQTVLQPGQESIVEGSTATNPQTGEKIIFRGGTWQTIR